MPKLGCQKFKSRAPRELVLPDRALRFPPCRALRLPLLVPLRAEERGEGDGAPLASPPALNLLVDRPRLTTPPGKGGPGRPGLKTLGRPRPASCSPTLATAPGVSGLAAGASASSAGAGAAGTACA